MIDLFKWLEDKKGVTYDQLDPDDKELFLKMQTTLESSEIDLDQWKSFLKDYHYSIDNQLGSHELTKERDIFLKGQLKLIIVLIAFLDKPERAMRELEQQFGVSKS